MVEAVAPWVQILTIRDCVKMDSPVPIGTIKLNIIGPTDQLDKRLLWNICCSGMCSDFDVTYFVASRKF